MYKQLFQSKASQQEFQQASDVLDSTMEPEYAKETNIHSSTGLLGLLCKKHFIILDEQYNLSKLIITANAMNFEIVVKEILELAQQKYVDKVANIQGVLATIRASAGIEPETGLSVKDLLMSTWALTKHREMPYSKANVQKLVIDNLSNNIEAGGKCLAGISARLTQPYCVFVRDILKRAIKEPTIEEIEAQFAALESSEKLTSTNLASSSSSSSNSSVAGVGFMRGYAARQTQSSTGVPFSAVNNTVGVELDPETKAILQSLYGDNWAKPKM